MYEKLAALGFDVTINRPGFGVVWTRTLPERDGLPAMRIRIMPHHRGGADIEFGDGEWTTMEWPVVFSLLSRMS